MAKTKPNGHMPLKILERRLKSAHKVLVQRSKISESLKYVAKRDKGRVPYSLLAMHVGELAEIVATRKKNRSKWA